MEEAYKDTSIALALRKDSLAIHKIVFALEKTSFRKKRLEKKLLKKKAKLERKTSEAESLVEPFDKLVATRHNGVIAIYDNAIAIAIGTKKKNNSLVTSLLVMRESINTADFELFVDRNINQKIPELAKKVDRAAYLKATGKE